MRPASWCCAEIRLMISPMFGESHAGSRMADRSADDADHSRAQSGRSAVVGSIATARRAGTAQATAAVTIRTNAVPTVVTGSLTLTPMSALGIARTRSRATNRPLTAPTASPYRTTRIASDSCADGAGCPGSASDKGDCVDGKATNTDYRRGRSSGHSARNTKSSSIGHNIRSSTTARGGWPSFRS